MRSFQWFKEGIAASWQLLKVNLGFLLKVLVITILVNGVMQLLLGQWAEINESDINVVKSLLFILSSVASMIVSVGLDAGKDKILLSIVDKKKASLNQLLVPGRMIFNLLVASMLYGLMVVVGLFLLIIPGIYLAIKYSQYPLVIIDKNVGPFVAFEESGKLTKGKKWTLLGFGFFAILFNLLGLLALIVGLLVTGAITTIANVWLYRKLEKEMGKD